MIAPWPLPDGTVVHAHYSVSPDIAVHRVLDASGRHVDLDERDWSDLHLDLEAAHCLENRT